MLPRSNSFRSGRFVSTGWLAVWAAVALATLDTADAQEQRPRRRERERQRQREVELTFPPRLPGGEEAVTVKSDEFLKPPESLPSDVAIAKVAPTVDFLYYPGQDYPGNPWSNWGDGTVANGKYYSAIGDHLALDRRQEGGGSGTAFVFEYDPESKTLRELVDVAELLDLPEGHYTPGKIHSRLDMGRDGWLYFSTHRGSTRVTTDGNHYRGDWIIRCDPRSSSAEVVVQGPVPKHCIPCSVLDPERLIFYGGTAAGSDAQSQEIHFFAYDVANRKLLYSAPHGPKRYLIFARSTGRVYYVPDEDTGPLVRFDPQSPGTPVETGQSIGLRAATQETPQGIVYTVSSGQRNRDANVWSFDTQTEEVRELGPLAVGSATYVTSIDADPAGRYLYYVLGAHGGAERDGSPVVQFDVETGRRKVIAFLHPYFRDHYGCTPVGTFSTAVSEDGGTLFITWNINRGGRSWDCCGLMAVHIPESERTP